MVDFYGKLVGNYSIHGYYGYGYTYFVKVSACVCLESKKTLPLVKYLLKKTINQIWKWKTAKLPKRLQFTGAHCWESNGETIFVDILLADFGHRVPQWSHGDFCCWSSERSGFSKFTGFLTKDQDYTLGCPRLPVTVANEVYQDPLLKECSNPCGDS